MGKKVLVTGGCSFIGSHLVEALVRRGARVRVVDDLSSGREANLTDVPEGTVEMIRADLLQPGVAEQAVHGMQNVFHLAANHGGRGYIDTHQTACSTNLGLDALLFAAAHRAGVEHVTYASSGCVYPTDLQADPSQTVYLREDSVGPPYQADGMYGWAKLMAELSLRQYYEEHGLHSASLRYFTVYGERCTESHALLAMIARAFTGQDPFVVWGTGQQRRNWTYVGDIVEGTIRAAERIQDGQGVNLGTTERTSVLEAAQMILTKMEHTAEIQPDPSKPSGPQNRVADNELARELLDWTDLVPLEQGLDRTIEWYLRTNERSEVKERLQKHLFDR